MKLRIALLVLAPAAMHLGTSSAQSGGMAPRKHTGALQAATLDLRTGEVTKASRATGLKAGTTATTWSNLDHTGFIGVDTGSLACEWISHGIKPGKGLDAQSTYMQNFAFAYCSAALDVNSGGSGGTTAISFYEGYTLGGQTGLPGSAPNGAVVASFTLTGMPANTGSTSFFGNLRCYVITVEVDDDLVCFADGPIGYSWKFVDLGTDGILAATVPFMSCVSTCSGFGPDGAGQVNQMDRYCPPGSLLESFTFTTATGANLRDVNMSGRVGASFSSVSMSLQEVVPLDWTQESYNSMLFTPNPNILTSSTPPRIGTTWSASLDCGGVAGLFFAALIAFDRPDDALLVPGCVLLIDLIPPSNLVFYCPVLGPPSVVPFDKPIPKRLEYLDYEFYVQGACAGVALSCSNGLHVITGT